MLLNNGGGKIFQHVKGMPADDIQATFVSAEHNTSAQGICRQNGARHLLVDNVEALQKGIAELINYDGERPIVLEVNLT